MDIKLVYDQQSLKIVGVFDENETVFPGMGTTLITFKSEEELAAFVIKNGLISQNFYLDL